jgi:hypothetical protein
MSSTKNHVKFKYVLNDIWFASSQNMEFVKNVAKKEFIMPRKRNRKVALSKKDKQNGHFVRVDSLELGEGQLVWLQGMDFPVCLVRKVFKNEDGSTGTFYLVSSDLMLTDGQVAAIYKIRWKVEEYHQSLKDNVSLAKSPTKTRRTQSNHIFASMCYFARLEAISLRHNTNHFAIKGAIYVNAFKAAFKKLEEFCTTGSCQSENCYMLHA